MLEINKIHQGDCLELMKNISDKSINLIICDLPYGIHSMEWDCEIDLNKLWEQYNRIIKDDGGIILFSSNSFTHKLALSNLKMYKYDLIWKKSKCGSPFTAKYMPLKKHETILIFGKGRIKYFSQLISGEPYKRKWTPNKVNNLKYGIKGVQTDNKGTRHPTTILDFPQKWRRQDQIHPTQKPVELIEWLINSYSEKKDIILDNTIGSGTTAIACINTDRNFIGIELDKEYFEIAKKRIEKHSQQSSLLPLAENSKEDGIPPTNKLVGILPKRL